MKTEEEKKARKKAWEEANKERVKQCRHEYYIANRQKEMLYAREYRKAHLEECKERGKIYYQKNKQEILRKAKEYWQRKKSEGEGDKTKPKRNICNLDCFNCIFDDCILP